MFRPGLATNFGRALAVLASMGLAACQASLPRDPAQSANADPTGAGQAAQATGLDVLHGGAPWPAGPEWVRTTSPDIYMGNLDSRIEALAHRTDPAALRDQAALRWYRYCIVGRLEDAEAALKLIDHALAEIPGDEQALLVRGLIRGGLHRFNEARSDLQAAGRSNSEALRALDELEYASGGGRAIVGRLANRDSAGENLYELALRGNLAVQHGDAEAADRWFRLAQSRFRDTSPLPLAWLHVQQGIAWLRFDEIERANRFFEAAYQRLPQYYLAVEHLAETEFLLGRPERARLLYRKVVSQTDNPEFHGALAQVQAELGDADGAAESLRRAREGYEHLLARHQAAFADHAARFYLEVGEPYAALELARINLESRRDVMAWLLLAETEAAAGSRRAACRALRRARDTGLTPPELDQVARTVGRCRR